MYFEKHQHYLAQFQKGIKKISFRTLWLQLCKGMEVQLCKCRESYDLHFTQCGRIIAAFEYLYHENKATQVIKHIYAYSNTGQLLMIMSVDAITKVLVMEIEFEYDESGRIVRELVLHYCKQDDCIYEQSFIHTYEGNYRRTEYTEEGLYEENYCVEEHWYDEKGNTIERRSSSSEVGLHLWFRYELDAGGSIIKEYEVCESGESREVEQFRGMWRTITEHEDDKGLTREIDLRDGEPVWIREKKVERYD